ncbi:MAG: DUF5399 family protein, partial [Simkaniaceae bacterium]|nr:DUF5399 family protein [Simkaniaceae bacterium]
MASSKTIDNMGMDVSNQYASADHLHASSLVQDARMVTTQAQKDQNIPSYSPELSLIFQTNEKNRPFAEIDSPQGYETTTNAAYLFSFIPSLGGKDKIEAMTHRNEHYIDQLKTSMGSVSDPKIINH